ncbi:hypothetical protein HYT84_02185, partial [Candidatus Micrarchaeota archaeon]|nr:hypothetical protein [Candidatus Micrarchaeota archaeon]
MPEFKHPSQSSPYRMRMRALALPLTDHLVKLMDLGEKAYEIQKKGWDANIDLRELGALIQTLNAMGIRIDGSHRKDDYEQHAVYREIAFNKLFYRVAK